MGLLLKMKLLLKIKKQPQLCHHLSIFTLVIYAWLDKFSRLLHMLDYKFRLIITNSVVII